MTDVFQVVTLDPAIADKIKKHLEKVKQAQADNPDAESSINAANEQFKDFFANYGKPTFTANTLQRNDTARSSAYNENLTTLDDDLSRLYASLDAAAKGSLTAFNFATIVSKEIAGQADASASKVLDLNIFNGFTQGQVIVAGDDFVDQSKIDTAAGIDTSLAEILGGANALGLKRVSSVPVTTPDVKVTITPVKPVGQNGKVNTEPTPLNLERFYEGKFYSYIGQQEPEGGQLQLKYIVNPASIPASISTTTVNGQPINGQSQVGAEAQAQQAQANSNFFAVVQATEEAKQQLRARMFDGNPDTIWQCEYVYKTDPLVDPLDQNGVDLETNNA